MVVVQLYILCFYSGTFASLQSCVWLQGVMNHDLTLEAEDIAEAAMLPLITTALCVPKEITLDTTQIPG